MPSPTPTPSTPEMGTTKYSVSRGGMQGKPLALPGEKLYNIVHAVRPGAVVQVVCAPVQAFGGSEPQKLPHFLFFILIYSRCPKNSKHKKQHPREHFGSRPENFFCAGPKHRPPAPGKNGKPLEKARILFAFSPAGV